MINAGLALNKVGLSEPLILLLHVIVSVREGVVGGGGRREGQGSYGLAS